MSQKVAYVTGGMGGIGTAICQRLHDDGFKVIAGCGPTRDYTKWLDEQKALGYTFYASVGNVGDWESTVEAFSKTKAEHGSIDVLVNNAGITRDRMFIKMTPEDWRSVIETNLNSMFNVTKQVVADMVEKGWGRIINISSVNGEKGQAGQTNYSAAKAGMHGFSMALAQELATKGVAGSDAVLALAEQAYTRFAAEDAKKATELSGFAAQAAGSAENWAVVRTWAAAEATPQEKAQVNAAIAQGGLVAQGVISQLVSLYQQKHTLPKDAASVAKPGAAGSAAPTAGPMTAQAYAQAVEQLRQKYGSNTDSTPEYAALQSQRLAARRAGY